MQLMGLFKVMVNWGGGAKITEFFKATNCGQRSGKPSPWDFLPHYKTLPV